MKRIALEFVSLLFKASHLRGSILINWMIENLQLSNVVSPRLGGVNYENCVEI